MVERLSTVSLLSGSVKDQIVQRSDGLPLFVEELTRSVLESAGHAVTGSQQASPVNAIPRTLHDSLMARLDRLEEGKEVAQAAAVIGREFCNDWWQG
jgi:predicted ATPase